ncbi:MAG: hypothetical protein RLZZ584_4413 [Pseudomonadota bacterium]
MSPPDAHSAKAATAAAADAAPDATRLNRPALAAVLLAVAMATLDTAIANTALPAIAADLQASAAASVWVITAYHLAVVASLLPFAALGDTLGPRRVYLGGLVFFTLASLVCALAPSLPWLAAARLLQGIGAGALMSVNLALVRALFPAAQLGRGVGVNALVVGLSFAIGPTIASLVLSVAGWPWLFAVNVPVGLVALACALPALPGAPRPDHPRLDGLTAACTATTFAALVLALGMAAQREPWPWVAGPAALALLAGALLLRRQAGHAAPMLPVDLLRRPLFALSSATSIASFTAQGLAFVALPFYFEAVLGRDAIETGFLMTPWAVVVALAAPLAGRLSDRHAPGLLGGIGLAVLSLGLVALALLPVRAPVADIVWRMALCGAGFGFFQSPNLRALMSAAPPERSGGASGMVAMSRLLGQSCGAALVALCFGLAGTAGATWALVLGAGFAALAAATSTARLWAR